jgi:hypothetical protein
MNKIKDTKIGHFLISGERIKFFLTGTTISATEERKIRQRASMWQTREAEIPACSNFSMYRLSFRLKRGQNVSQEHPLIAWA